MDFSIFQKNHPERYKALASKISKCFNSNYTSQFFNSVAKKEGNWFGQTKVNFVLKMPTNQQKQACIYYEKSLEIAQNGDCVPQQPVKFVLLNDIKMIARSQNTLTIAFVVQNKKLDEWILHFYSQQITAEWETLLKENKHQLKNIKLQSNDKESQIKELRTKIKTLQKELAEMKLKFENLLAQKQTIQNENVALMQQNYNLIQQNTSINQTISKYRKIILNIEDHQSLAEKKRRSAPLEMLASFQAQERIAIFYISQGKWKQCLGKIENICFSFELIVQKNQIANEFQKLIKDLRTSVHFLKNSVIVLAAKDQSKAIANNSMDICQGTS